MKGPCQSPIHPPSPQGVMDAQRQQERLGWLLEEVGKRIGEGVQAKARDDMEHLRKHRWFSVMLRNSDFILKAVFTRCCKDREGGARDGENRKQWKKRSGDGKRETIQ